MAPKGLYSVQKSRSFGGSHNFHDTPPKDQPLSPEQGRKTPNFDSLRKKFSKKKTTSFDDDDGDIVDGGIWNKIKVLTSSFILLSGNYFLKCPTYHLLLLFLELLDTGDTSKVYNILRISNLEDIEEDLRMYY